MHVAANEELKCVFIIKWHQLKDFLPSTVSRVSLRSPILENACTQSQPQKEISHLPTPVLHGREGCLELLGIPAVSARIRQEWGLCVREGERMGEPLAGSALQGVLLEPFGSWEWARAGELHRECLSWEPKSLMLCKPSHASDIHQCIMCVLHQGVTDPNHAVSQSQSHGELVLPKYFHHIFQWLSLMH